MTFHEIAIEGRICLEPKVMSNGGGMFKIACSVKKGDTEKEYYYTIFCSAGQVNLIKSMGYKVGDTLIIRGVPELDSKRNDRGEYMDKFSIRNPNITFGLKAKKNMALMSLESIAEELNPSDSKDKKLKRAIDEYLGRVPESAPKPEKRSWQDYE